ncbi:MAG: hypothetical protein KIT16_22780, partial [Rhodospirillaceae bacterium]|nr:hypothetical protein [Rhodospirillaceae bacterium]
GASSMAMQPPLAAHSGPPGFRLDHAGAPRPFSRRASGLGNRMSNEDLIEFSGTVTEVLPDAMFRVTFRFK